MGTKFKKVVWQRHHLVYPSDKNKEVTRKIRRGVHQCVTLLRRFNYLTEEEVDTICLEAKLKRRFKDEEIK